MEEAIAIIVIRKVAFFLALSRAAASLAA